MLLVVVVVMPVVVVRVQPSPEGGGIPQVLLVVQLAHQTCQLSFMVVVVAQAVSTLMLVVVAMVELEVPVVDWCSFRLPLCQEAAQLPQMVLLGRKDTSVIVQHLLEEVAVVQGEVSTL